MRKNWPKNNTPFKRYRTLKLLIVKIETPRVTEIQPSLHPGLKIQSNQVDCWRLEDTEEWKPALFIDSCPSWSLNVAERLNKVSRYFFTQVKEPVAVILFSLCTYWKENEGAH